MVTTALKLKMYFDSPEDKDEMNRYFDEYAKVATFAAKKILHLRGLYVNLPRKKVGDKWEPEIIDLCSSCSTKKPLIKEDKKTKERYCLECFSEEGLSDLFIRKKLLSTKRGYRGKPPRKVDPSLNVRNAGKIADTHYHHAVKDAIETIKAGKEQLLKRTRFLRRDEKRLRKFKEILESEEKRYQLPLKGGQRTPRYIHIEDKDIPLRGWTMNNVKSKIKILERNTNRARESLERPSLIKFRGKKVSLDKNLKFDLSNCRVKIPLWKSKEYGFSGTNVVNPHGQKFFREKLSKIKEGNYGVLIRKLKKNVSEPAAENYDFYLQYPIDEEVQLREVKNIMGVDIGLNKLAAVAIFNPANAKPFFVRILKDEAQYMRIKRRKQMYFLRGKHNKRQKIKRIRPIEPVIKQYYHRISKQIVKWAIEKNASIVMEKLEDLKKKAKARQRKEERYKLSLFVYKTIRDLIEYKAKINGIPIIFVQPEGTSYTCCKCGSFNTQRPAQAIFKCNDCGIQLNADYNAACNIARKALNNPEIIKQPQAVHA